MEKKKKDAQLQLKWQQLLGIGLFTALGIFCGALGAVTLERIFPEGMGAGGFLLSLGALTAAMLLVMWLQIILHEAGHLLGGLLTGYRFCSFRVGSLMWVLLDGRVRLRYLSLAGTGGQCLMSPPDVPDEKLPYALYNLGGPLMNIAVSVVVLGISHMLRDSAALIAALRLFAAAGIGMGLVNGIPLRVGNVDNDGRNALSLGKTPQALRAFRVQMQVNAMQQRGVRVKDMPDAWFAVPETAALDNNLVAVLPVLACNRSLDEHRFAQTREQIETLLARETGLAGLYRQLLACDGVTCSLLLGDRPGCEDALDEKSQRKFMRQMKSYPAVLRTAYIRALLADGDRLRAERLRRQFERVAARYPYEAEIRAERELLELADAQSAHQAS